MNIIGREWLGRNILRGISFLEDMEKGVVDSKGTVKVDEVEGLFFLDEILLRFEVKDEGFGVDEKIEVSLSDEDVISVGATGLSYFFNKKIGEDEWVLMYEKSRIGEFWDGEQAVKFLVFAVIESEVVARGYLRECWGEYLKENPLGFLR